MNKPAILPVQFSSVVSDSLRPHGLQHARPPCPSPTPGVYSDSCPLSWWCHPTISSSGLLQSCPSIRVFTNESILHIRWPKYGVSASASVLPMNIQDWLSLGLTGCISLQCKIFERTPRSLLLVALTCSAWFIWAPYKVTMAYYYLQPLLLQWRS